MEQILLVLHILIAIFLVVLILIQQGKGATTGSAFGSGASSTVFGSQGSGSFLFKLTAFLAFLFFVNSLALVYLASRPAQVGNAMSIQMPGPVIPQAPTAPTSNTTSTTSGDAAGSVSK